MIYGPLTPGQVCRRYSFLPHFEGNSLLSLRVRCKYWILHYVIRLLLSLLF